MFDFEMDLKSGNALVLFTGQLEGDDGYYGDKIDHILKRRNKLYAEVILLFPKYIEPKIKGMLFDDSKLVSNLKRDSRVSQISLITFDGYADLQPSETLIENGTSSISLKELKKDVIKHGFWALVASRKDKVILKSPSGTIFQKPSGDRFSEFIKAAELAVGFSENQFVAFALLAHRPKRENKHAIKHIWIDTPSISNYIEALIYYITKFNCDEFRPLQYHSFQSYGDDKNEGYKVCVPEVKDNIWVIISASRSNNLGVDIYDKWQGLQHDQIVTLLSYTDSKNLHIPLCGSDICHIDGPARSGDNIVVNISKFSDAHQFEIKHGSEVPVKIIGENFTAQVEAPHAVILRAAHGPAEIKKFIEPNNQCNNLALNKLNKNRLRPAFFDFVAFSNNQSVFFKEYLDWLKDVVNWYVPRSVGAIIYDKNDAASCQLLGHVKGLIDFKNIEETDINGEINIKKDCAIIALLPIMTRGNTLVKLNSDLRLANHSAQRIFITPFAICSSRMEYNAFEKSLTYAPKCLKYQFVNFRRVFIGHQEHKYSWELELAVVERFSHSIWRDRAKNLRMQSQGILNGIGVCCSTEKDKLDFNKDFAFWSSKYEPENVTPPAVYLTVSAILQNLREKPPTAADKDSLCTQVYQHSVLHPSNFSRFNDPLLQSCLWRCAYDRELDYRSQNDLSKQFCDIVIRLAQCRAKGQHNATLDLLVGIAVRKIQLAKEYLSTLIAELKAILEGIDEFTEILCFIDSGFELLTSNDEAF